MTEYAAFLAPLAAGCFALSGYCFGEWIAQRRYDRLLVQLVRSNQIHPGAKIENLPTAPGSQKDREAAAIRNKKWRKPEIFK